MDSPHILYLQNRVAYAADEAAYRKLFFHFQPPLKHFALGMINSVEEAEELVADVLLKVWTMGEKLGLIHDIKAYLFKSVKNSCINFLKSSTYKNNKVTDDFSAAVEQVTAAPAEYTYTEMQVLVYETIDQLPPKCQLVFKLVKEYGMSYRQVGEVMDISQNTIETHMRLALKKLKQVLGVYLNEKK